MDKAQEHDFEDLSGRVIGCAIQVHKSLGPGFLETIYEEALKIEFGESEIAFQAQMEIPTIYRSVRVGTHRLDLVVENRIIVELKAVKEITDIYYSQLRSYLKAASLKIGLLINFSKSTLEIKRIVN